MAQSNVAGEERDQEHGSESYSVWRGEGSLVAKTCQTIVILQTMARQAPLSMGFPRREYWSGLPFPSPGALPNPGIKPRSPALQVDSLLLSLQGSLWGWVGSYDSHTCDYMQTHTHTRTHAEYLLRTLATKRPKAAPHSREGTKRPLGTEMP